MDQRLQKPEGIGQVLHQGGAGILKPHPSLDIGLDRTHRNRLNASICSDHSQARDPMLELDRWRYIEKRTVSDAAAADRHSDRCQQARAAKDAVGTGNTM